MRANNILGIVCLVAGMVGIAQPAQAQEKYLGEIMMTGANFCPRGTLNASGQLLPISQNTALFSLYGTIYGGDGRTTFALPDLRGRTAINAGQGPGLQAHNIGSRFGSERATISALHTPARPHEAINSNLKTPVRLPDANLPVDERGAATQPEETVEYARGGQSIPTVGPSLAITYCVVTQGIYPSRN